MCKNGQNSASGQIFNPQLETPWAVSYSITNFCGAYYKSYACFEQKRRFCNAKIFGIGRVVGVGVTIFEKPPKGTSLADFARFEPFFVAFHRIYMFVCFSLLPLVGEQRFIY